MHRVGNHMVVQTKLKGWMPSLVMELKRATMEGLRVRTLSSLRRGISLETGRLDQDCLRMRGRFEWQRQPSPLRSAILEAKTPTSPLFCP